MIRLRHQQLSPWGTFFAEEVAELWEPWMSAVDELLEDEELLSAVYDAQGQRHSKSRTHGRHALRHKGPEGEEKRKREYRELLHMTRQILGDTRKVLQEVDGMRRRRRSRARGLCEQLANHGGTRT